MPPCPEPQNVGQRNSNIPALSGVNSTLSIPLTLKSGITMPCVVSVFVRVIFTRSPFLTVITFGVYWNLAACNEIRRGVSEGDACGVSDAEVCPDAGTACCSSCPCDGADDAPLCC